MASEIAARTRADIALRPRPGRLWWVALAGALALVGLLVVAVGILLLQGVGVWGNNIPVTWALDIVSYDWWMSVACGGLLISGLLMLFDAASRSALNRVAETMALFAAAAGAIYPIIHLGRPWFFYWNLPYPTSLLLWPQFRSPLFWDAADIISFLVVCASFWYVGMLPDLAALRDRAAVQARIAGGRGLRLAQLYGIAALGWRGSAAHWHRWSRAYRALGMFSVLSAVTLQTGASVMFAGTVEPGWHDTLMPFAFLVIALWSGAAAATALLILVRRAFAAEALITARHLDLLGRLLLGLGLLGLYCYLTQAFVTVLTGDRYDVAVLARRFSGAHAWATWVILACALLPVHVFWSARMRRSPAALFVVGVLVSVGMYADHFMLIVGTLQHDFLPSSAQPYRVGLWGVATLLGDFGLFALLLLLALRYLPAVSILKPPRTFRTGPFPPPTDEQPIEAPLWGVSAEFGSSAAMVAAVALLRARALRHVEAYSPMPVPAVATALRLARPAMTSTAVIGMLVGGGAMMLLCTYATVWDYPFDIGGRPRFSWPAFVIPSVAVGMLAGALAVTWALLLHSRLPRLNHPAFNIPGFERATADRFFAVAVARDDNFDPAAVECALMQLAAPPLHVCRVPR